MKWLLRGETSVFQETFLARTEEIQTMGLDGARNGMFYALVQVFLRGNVEVPDLTALKTDEMIVLINEGIITSERFPKIQFTDFSLLFEDVQITIDRPERDFRHMFLDTLENPLGRRMRTCFSEYL